MRVEGWCATDFKNDCPEDVIEKIEVLGLGDFSYKSNCPSPNICQGTNKKFIIDIYLKNKDVDLSKATINFFFQNNRIVKKSVQDLSNERRALYISSSIENHFRDQLKPSDKILDIGGRDRSRYDRSKDFEQEVTVFDVAEGDNVDIVGDAHDLSRHFPRQHFDAAMSVFVFEHLAMPWKVVLEINKILKVGGVVYVQTHQTIALHDSPWDFFRFSEDCWPILFNKYTGFEILQHGSDCEQFVIPFIYHDGKRDAEKTAGREHSYVIARKISDSGLEWPAPLKSLINNDYPLNDDGQNI